MDRSDMFIYALGTIKISNKVVGHSGQTFGFQTYIGIDDKTKDIYILAGNNAGVDLFRLYMGLIN